MPKSPPILITGIPRSGTSLVAGIIDICGAFGGRMLLKGRDNPTGFFENRAVRSQLVKKHLRSMKACPRGVEPLPDPHSVPSMENLSETFYRIYEKERWDGKSPIYYKEPKLLLVWPAWHRAFPSAKWVIARRNTPDVLRSARRASFFRHSEPTDWMQWLDYHRERIAELSEATDNHQVYYEEIVDDPQILQPVIQWLGLEWNQEKIEDFIEVRE